MLIKILWAFVWQEFFIPLPFLYTTIPLGIGAYCTEAINAFASNLSGFPQTDKAVVEGKNLYPGQAMCRQTSAHSLWHEESANGFLEIALIADTMHKLTTKTAGPEEISFTQW